MPDLPQPRLAGWLLFFIFSLSLHLLLLLWPLGHSTQAEQVGETPLAVTLASNSADSVTSAVAPPANQHRQHHTAPALQDPPAEKTPAETVRTESPAPAEPQKETASTKTSVTASLQMPFAEQRYSGNSAQMSPSFGQELLTGPAPDAVDAANDDISSQIRTRFAEHFSYPLLAQRNGWEGEVVLVFHVEIDGTLSNIRVQKSSGHALLDESAIASLRAIGKVEFNKGLLLRHSLELRMPVVYHLAQG